ncbi:MAG TPA: 4-hydroxybenzoate octaprenyltransferase [Burkholderiales bacterium]
MRERLDAYEKLMRLDKPIGILLLLWPTLWGVWISSRGQPNWMVLWVFVMGTVLMRSAGCVMNDFADRNFDPHVERTRNRPLAAGLVRPGEALLLAAALALAAFLMVLVFNRLTILLAIAAAFLAATYPFTKRFLPIPQAYLGIAFAFGIPMAFAAHNDYLPTVAWVMLAASAFWTIAYDTEYAMVDREDDLKIGIKSSAITFGRHDVTAVMACHGIFLAAMAGIGMWLHMGLVYYLGLAAALGLVLYQFTLIRGRDRQLCFRAFLHNNWVGAAVFAGIALDYLVNIRFEP